MAAFQALAARATRVVPGAGETRRIGIQFVEWDVR
jgi:hypothetical protein